jgi:hypothetical protein
MPEIAYTALGRNALFAGLISHVAALLVAMLSASGREHFFGIVLSFACLALMTGAYAELRDRGRRPLSNWRFYAAAAATVIPLLGPLAVLGVLYHLQPEGQEQKGGLSGPLGAFFRLKANALVIFLLLALLLILFVVTNSQDDPYYKKRYRNDQNRNVPQSVLTRDFCTYEMRK